MSESDALVTPRHRWGERLLGVLEQTGPAAARAVQRGQALARRGVVDDLTFRRGRVTGTVHEDRVAGLQVSIGWPTTDPSGWDEATGVLGRRLRPLATLLQGSLTEELVDDLTAAGIELVPSVAELHPSCSCEAGGWCRHVAAVFTVAAARIDRQPLLLLELAGRSAEELLLALRGEAPGSVTVEEPVEAFDPRDLDAIELHPAPVEHPERLFQQLGPPPGVDDTGPFESVIARAAATAWQLAAGDGAEAADEAALLTELRSQRVGTVASLSEVLGWSSDTVERGLEALFARGEVLRTGAGERMRYRASSG